jgi:uncharacterized protein (DUF3084 family)
MISQKDIKKVITETLDDANIQVINPNELLYAHTNHIRQLEKKIGSLQNQVKAYEKRLDFVEQAAREAIAYVESDPYIKERKASEQALAEAVKAKEDAAKLVKYCHYFAKELKK